MVRIGLAISIVLVAGQLPPPAPDSCSTPCGPGQTCLDWYGLVPCQTLFAELGCQCRGCCDKVHFPPPPTDPPPPSPFPPPPPPASCSNPCQAGTCLDFHSLNCDAITQIRECSHCDGCCGLPQMISPPPPSPYQPPPPPSLPPPPPSLPSQLPSSSPSRRPVAAILVAGLFVWGLSIPDVSAFLQRV